MEDLPNATAIKQKYLYRHRIVDVQDLENDTERAIVLKAVIVQVISEF